VSLQRKKKTFAASNGLTLAHAVGGPTYRAIAHAGEGPDRGWGVARLGLGGSEVDRWRVAMVCHDSLMHGPPYTVPGMDDEFQVPSSPSWTHYLKHQQCCPSSRSSEAQKN
jgi:hypothetical protein